MKGQECGGRNVGQEGGGRRGAGGGKRGRAGPIAKVGIHKMQRG